jgi:hypothetical protein
VARGDSTIKVTFLGDTKNLVGALGTVDTKTDGLVKSGAKVVGTGIAVKKGFDLVNDSLQEADRRGDAIQRLTDKIGKIPTDKLVDTADNFHEIGASSQDMLELEAIYADLATSAGIAAPDIAANAEALAASAIAAAQTHDADPSAIIDAIGKAAGGSTRGLKPYGVDLTEAAVQQKALDDTGKTNPKTLSDTELAAARTALIIQGFAGQLNDATTGSGDLEIKQDELGAKFEEVGGKAGSILAPALGDVLDFINDEIDAIPGAIEGWQLFGQTIVTVAEDVLTPLARAYDTARALLDIVGLLPHSGVIAGSTFSKQSDRSISDAQRREDELRGTMGHGGP